MVSRVVAAVTEEVARSRLAAVEHAATPRMRIVLRIRA